jgi:hypothetical protein
MWKLLTPLIVVALGVTGVVIWYEPDERSGLFFTLIGTFWGFLLAQIGIVLYGNRTEKEELIAMMTSARSELIMNQATVAWISHLLDSKQEQVDVHGLGFAGTDKISIAAVETLVRSPLTYKWASPTFVAKPLLTIYQTLVVIQREIPTTDVGPANASKYGSVRFPAVDKAFQTLTRLLDDEGEKLCGVKRWMEIRRTIEADRPGATEPSADDRTERIIELLESIYEKMATREIPQPDGNTEESQ